MDDDGTEVNETENKQNPNKVLNIALWCVCLYTTELEKKVCCLRPGGRSYTG